MIFPRSVEDLARNPDLAWIINTGNLLRDPSQVSVTSSSWSDPNWLFRLVLRRSYHKCGVPCPWNDIRACPVDIGTVLDHRRVLDWLQEGGSIEQHARHFYRRPENFRLQILTYAIPGPTSGLLLSDVVPITAMAWVVKEKGLPFEVKEHRIIGPLDRYVIRDLGFYKVPPDFREL